MCIAVPGKLIWKNEGQGKVDINGNILPVQLGLVCAQVGDYVLVHAGCAITVLPKDEHEELDELLRLLREVTDEQH